MSILNLNIKLKDLDTSYPSLAISDYRVEVKSFELKPSTKTPGLQTIRVNVETLEPATDAASGKELAPGFKTGFGLTLPYAPGQEQFDEMREKSLASFLDACFNTEQGTRPDLTGEVLNDCIGKQIMVKVGKAKDETFGLTEVKSWKPVVVTE